MELKMQPVEISGLMKEIESTAQGKINPTVIFNCVLGANTLFINTDPALLKDILTKFIDNAAKFTDRGSVTFGYDVSDDELYFYVKDTGIGVPRNMQDDLFEDTGDNSESSLIKAKDEVEALGGEIGVESRGAGKGSTFWFTIPNSPAEAPAGYQYVSTERPAPAETTREVPVNAPQAPAHDVTILIAEDNESNYALFRSLLESRYNLIHALNGQEAIDLFKDNKVDLILMDINMPIKDGYEATREIREVSSQVPIVAVTAYAFTTDKQRIFDNGFNAYVSKPISINRLERVINDLINK